MALVSGGTDRFFYIFSQIEKENAGRNIHCSSIWIKCSALLRSIESMRFHRRSVIKGCQKGAQNKHLRNL